VPNKKLKAEREAKKQKMKGRMRIAIYRIFDTLWWNVFN